MTKENKPLVTAIILNYNNGDLIFETLKSVLMQDYANIELIISDDCSDFFKEEEIRNYVKNAMHENIQRFIINRNKENLGTVKHLETVREMMTGEIEICIAADDCWAYKSAFSDFVNKFIELGPEAEWVTSQIEMRDEKLEKFDSLFITADVIRLLKSGDMKKLLDVELERCALPGPGSAFRKSFFEKIGNLSNDYHITEDYPAHLRWLRLGYRVYYLNRVTLLHRHGGISHGNSQNSRNAFIHYMHDLVTLFKRDVEPYKDVLSASAYSKAESKYNWNLRTYMAILHPVSAIVLHFRPNISGWKTIDSILNQYTMNSEIIIGTGSSDVDALIDHINNVRFTQSADPSRKEYFNHIEVISDKEDLTEEEYLKELSNRATNSYQIIIESGCVLKHHRVFAEYALQFTQNKDKFNLENFLSEYTFPKLSNIGQTGIKEAIKGTFPFFLIKAKLIEISTLRQIKSSLVTSIVLLIIAMILQSSTGVSTLNWARRIVFFWGVAELLLALFKLALNFAIHAYRILRRRKTGV